MFLTWYSLEAILPLAALPVAVAVAWVLDMAKDAIRKVRKTNVV